MKYYIRTDYGVRCNNKELSYWIISESSAMTYNVIDNLLTFPIYRVKFRDVKDFDFDRRYMLEEDD